MKTRDSKIEAGGWWARSVLECGSPPPLSKVSPRRVATQSARGLAQSKTWRNFVAAVALWATAIAGSAQIYSIDWFKIAGGGGTSTGGVYTLSGTIGQPDAGGPLTNGQFSVTGGFWALPQAVPTEGAPTLTIAKGAPGFAFISWSPATGTNWVLQEALNLTGSWTNSPSGRTNSITVPATPPTKFYRLYKP